MKPLHNLIDDHEASEAISQLLEFSFNFNIRRLCIQEPFPKKRKKERKQECIQECIHFGFCPKQGLCAFVVIPRSC